jgi:hypothetical protein
MAPLLEFRLLVSWSRGECNLGCVGSTRIFPGRQEMFGIADLSKIKGGGQAQGR